MKLLLVLIQIISTTITLFLFFTQGHAGYIALISILSLILPRLWQVLNSDYPDIDYKELQMSLFLADKKINLNKQINELESNNKHIAPLMGKHPDLPPDWDYYEIWQKINNAIRKGRIHVENKYGKNAASKNPTESPIGVK